MFDVRCMFDAQVNTDTMKRNPKFLYQYDGLWYFLDGIASGRVSAADSAVSAYPCSSPMQSNILVVTRNLVRSNEEDNIGGESTNAKHRVVP